MPNSVSAQPQTESFEYHVRHLLARYNLSGTTQTAIGNEILRLARRHLGLDTSAPSGSSGRRFSGGSLPHLFRSSESTSVCGRLKRDQLQTWRIIDDFTKFLTLEERCTHCYKTARLDPRNLTVGDISATLMERR